MMQSKFFSLSMRVTLVSALLTIGLFVAEAAAKEKLDPGRIETLARMLPATARGAGPVIDDRAAWQEVAKSPGFKGVVSQAEKLMSRPMPELTDDLFLDFSRTGNRTRCQRVLSGRHSRFPSLVLAECMENRGRFLPAIEEAIRAVCSEKTWVMPAHDRSLKNFNGEVNEVDLAVAAVSWNMATADYWLGDKLSGEVRKLIGSELERRTLKPFESYVHTGQPRMWWATGTNNWNAVCLAGVTGTALAAIESPERRAFFVAAAEKYVEYFLQGFTPDGYCSEGMGYWNYGFGHYVLLGETICQATGGRVDLFERPKIPEIARFGPRMEIGSGVYPAFADCSVRASPDPRTMAFLSRRFGLGMKDVESQGLLLAGGSSTSLFTLGVHGFANSASQRPVAEGPAPAQPLRDWFPDAGIIICRAAPGKQNALGVALKGGHNSEHHNHNDVGSFVVAFSGTTPLLDPGGEVYTARTFSKDRYVSGVLNSLGHSVPRVAGQLQRTGRAAAARIVNTEFGDQKDTLVLDLRAAYGVKELKKLQRTFIFSREGNGSLSVIDEVEFASPQSFDTALITFSKWRQPDSDRLLVGEGSGAVEVEISTAGQKWRLEPEKIEEELSGGRIPTRLGIELTEQVTEAVVTLTITPAK